MPAKLMIFRKNKTGYRVVIHLDIDKPITPPWIYENGYPISMTIAEVKEAVKSSARSYLAELLDTQEASLADEGEIFNLLS
jgi:hypothetical protein